MHKRNGDHKRNFGLYLINDDFEPTGQPKDYLLVVIQEGAVLETYAAAAFDAKQKGIL